MQVHFKTTLMLKKSMQFVALIGIVFFSYSDANANVLIPSTTKVMHTVTDSFAVSGNCGMCKKTIEAALKDVDGVISATWNKETKMITVHYNPHSISLNSMKQKIADVGYDTDTIKAKKETYDGLPGCCQYERE